MMTDAGTAGLQRRGTATLQLPAEHHSKEARMPQRGRIVYGTITGPAFHTPVRAMVLYREDGTRVWRPLEALRWVMLPPTAVFTPDQVQPPEA
jgi:hypothetical protein